MYKDYNWKDLMYIRDALDVLREKLNISEFLEQVETELVKVSEEINNRYKKEYKS